MTEEQSGMPPASAVAAVFIAAWLARTAAVVLLPNVHHPDEIFQSLEQAHRLVFGYGFVPWEFEHAVRSWILPSVLAGVMRASRFLGEGPQVYLPVIGAVLGALGAAAVVCVFLWAYRLFGLWLGLVAAAVPAFAPELIHFNGKALTEVVGGHLLVIALYLAFPGREVRNGGRLAMAGALATLAVAIRLQIAPAVILIGLVVLVRWPLQKAMWPTIGALLVVAFAGTLDWVTWGSPFLSYRHNFTYNLIHGVASHFGENPWFDYFAQLLVVWGGALVAVIVFGAIGARFLPLAAAVAAVILATHLPIAHKELRFLYPAMFIAQALVGLGIAASVDWLLRSGILANLPHSLSRPRWQAAAGTALLALFIVGRLPAFMMTPAAGSPWIEKRDDVEASLAVSRLASVCGIGAYGLGWPQLGGYSQMHQPVPFFEARDAAQFAAKLPAFNTIIFDKALLRHVGLPDARCFGERCVVQRAGTCEARPADTLGAPPQLLGVRRVRELWPPASFPSR